MIKTINIIGIIIGFVFSILSPILYLTGEVQSGIYIGILAIISFQVARI